MKIRVKMNHSVVLDEEELKEINGYYLAVVSGVSHSFSKLCWEPVPEDNFDEMRESNP